MIGRSIWSGRSRRKDVTEDRRQSGLVDRLRQRQSQESALHPSPPADEDALLAADTIEALQQRVEELEEALGECAAPHLLGNQDGLNFEGLAREFNRRQQIADQALREEPGEGGGEPGQAREGE